MAIERIDPNTHAPVLYEDHVQRYRFAVSLVSGGKGLDLGCGVGYGSALLAEKARLVYAMDLAPEVLPRPGAPTGADPAAKAGRVLPLCGDAEHIPLADRSLDWVVSLEVIEHVRSAERYAAELARVLAPGGLAVISTPNRLRPVPGENPYHLREFDGPELRALLAASFGQVELLGQEADADRRRLYRRLDRVAGLDLFGLRRLVGPRLRDWFVRRIAGRRGAGAYRLSAEGAEGSRVFVAVCRQPRQQ